MNKVYQVYIDSDGVLAGFNEHFLALRGQHIHELDKRYVWKLIEMYNHSSPFFRNLPKLHDADALVMYVQDNFEQYAVLTATGTTPNDVEQQKRDWYAEHYPTLTVHCVKKSPEKAAQFATPTAILIDDRAKSIDPWVAAGGIGILHTSTLQTIEELKKYL